ncbi:MAG: hypothetical protein PHV43_02390 [Candidatus Colwellbacteria bacterium]|nr:hypothetical protein [Candidatus Colwellbacteria bacterium]
MAKPDFLKYLTPKTIINLSVILGFLLFVIPTLLFLGGEVAQRAASIRAQREQIDIHTRMISELTEFREASAEVKSAMIDLQTTIPPRERLFSFPQNVEQLGSDLGLAANVNFAGKEVPATGDTAGNNMFTITSKGSFDSTLSFIEAMEERREFLVSLESIDITKLEGQFNATIGGLVFFYD